MLNLIDTLNLKNNQYNMILSIFFIPYVLTSPFLGILGKKYGPNIILPSMMFTFGLCTILVVAVFNFSGLLAIRWFLGMAESAFFPLVIYYQTTYVCPSFLSHMATMATTDGIDFTVVENSRVVLPYFMPRKASLLHFQAFLLLGYFKSKPDRWQHGGTYSSLKEEVQFSVHYSQYGIYQNQPLKPNFSLPRKRNLHISVYNLTVPLL